MGIITPAQRDVLINHIDGRAVPLIRSALAFNGAEASRAQLNMMTTSALLRLRMLRTDGKIRPQTTFITEVGRAALVRALADWADAMTKVALYQADLAFVPEPVESPLKGYGFRQNGQ